MEMAREPAFCERRTHTNSVRSAKRTPAKRTPVHFFSQNAANHKLRTTNPRVNRELESNRERVNPHPSQETQFSVSMRLLPPTAALRPSMLRQPTKGRPMR
jgi:hypothetical protein